MSMHKSEISEEKLVKTFFFSHFLGKTRIFLAIFTNIFTNFHGSESSRAQDVVCDAVMQSIKLKNVIKVYNFSLLSNIKSFSNLFCDYTKLNSQLVKRKIRFLNWKMRNSRTCVGEFPLSFPFSNINTAAVVGKRRKKTCWVASKAPDSKLFESQKTVELSQRVRQLERATRVHKLLLMGKKCSKLSMLGERVQSEHYRSVCESLKLISARKSRRVRRHNAHP